MKLRARLCWWCNRRLSSVSHAIVEGRLVHKICEPEARANFKLITAQPEYLLCGREVGPLPAVADDDLRD